MGDRLGNYEILDELGRGGMGVVYRASDLKLGRQVAIKELLVTTQLSEVERQDTVERFRREAMAAARLAHPNIITVYDYGQEGDRPYMVMELLEGKNLGDYLDKKTMFSLQQVADIGAQICSALDYAHLSGIVHRDIKPDNIMLNANGIVKLTDFGVARVKSDLPSMTQTGTTLGTIAYISPEQLTDSRLVDGRSDLFSLGALLYEMLTFKTPFDAGNLGGTIINIMSMAPEPISSINPNCPPKLEAVIMRALKKNPDERFSRAAEMGHALTAALRDAERPPAPKIVDGSAAPADAASAPAAAPQPIPCRHCAKPMPQGSRVCPNCGRSETAPLSFPMPQAPARPGLAPPPMPQSRVPQMPTVQPRVPVAPAGQPAGQPMASQPSAHPSAPPAMPSGALHAAAPASPASRSPMSRSMGSSMHPPEPAGAKGIPHKVAGLQFVNQFGKQGFGQGEFQQPRGIALDPTRHLLVADTENGRVQVFDASGKFVRQIKPLGANESFRFPRAIAVNPLGIVFVTDDLDFRIYKFDGAGRQLGVWKRPRIQEENPSIPGRLVIAPNGSMYLSEPNNHRVLVYDANEKLLGAVGRDQGLQSPGGMVIDNKGQLCVLDFGTMMVHVFDRKLQPVMTFGKRGNAPGEFSVPRDMCIDRFGYFFIADTLNHRIQVFDPDGKFLVTYGKKGMGPGEFSGPEGLAMGADDRLYVTDRGNGRVQVFTIGRV
jgi:serine/threonine protein kinase/DNA-binding beta-propeller fold protein YncE